MVIAPQRTRPSHGNMQSVWKTCLQGSFLASSSSLNPLVHTGHCSAPYLPNLEATVGQSWSTLHNL